MRIHVYQCDQCERQHALDTMLVSHYAGEGLPVPWIIVAQAPVMADRVPLTFCGMRCLAAYATEMARRQDEG